MSRPSPRAPRQPIVGIPCDRRMIGPHPFHAVGEKYALAVAQASGALPVLIPVFEGAGALDPASILGAVDGLFLTGSPSNVEPVRYGGPPDAAMALDTHRDQTTLALIKGALAAAKPLFAVCRGLQEMNVALGGTLDPHLHRRPGGLDHRADDTAPIETQYAPAHEALIAPGGLLARLLGVETVMVNSLHAQGIATLALGLRVEATAPDGVIEAVSAPDAPAFALGVQWHPEWRVMDNPAGRALFAAFGAALRA